MLDIFSLSFSLFYYYIFTLFFVYLFIFLYIEHSLRDIFPLSSPLLLLFYLFIFHLYPVLVCVMLLVLLSWLLNASAVLALHGPHMKLYMPSHLYASRISHFVCQWIDWDTVEFRLIRDLWLLALELYDLKTCSFYSFAVWYVQSFYLGFSCFFLCLWFNQDWLVSPITLFFFWITIL